MIALNKQRATGNANPEEYSGFLRLLPRIEQLAQRAFRHLAPELAEEAIADVVAFAFVTYRRLIDLGKHELAYASPLANYGIRRYYAGRAAHGGTKAGDVYSQDARKRGGYTLQHLGNGQGPDAVWREMLVENSRTAVADQVQFRIDFSDWLEILPTRDRKMVLQLARGERVGRVARDMHVSSGRI